SSRFVSMPAILFFNVTFSSPNTAYAPLCLSRWNDRRRARCRERVLSRDRDRELDPSHGAWRASSRAWLHDSDLTRRTADVRGWPASFEDRHEHSQAIPDYRLDGRCLQCRVPP